MQHDHQLQATTASSARLHALSPRLLRRLAGGLGFIATLGAIGCNSTQQAQPQAFASASPAAALIAPPQWNPGTRPISETIGDVQPTTGNDLAELISSTSLNASRVASPASPSIASVPPGELTRVTYQASNARATDVLRVLIQDFLKEEFVLDPSLNINSGLTLSINRDMTRTQIRDLVASLALISGARLERTEGMLVLRPNAAASGSRQGANAAGAASPLAQNTDIPIVEAQTALGGGMPVMRVHTFQHVEPSSLVPFLQGFMTAGATMVTSGQVMVVADTADHVDRVAGLIDRLDVPAFAGTQLWTYRLKNRTPESAQTMLEAIATASGISDGATPAAGFIPITNSDRLLVVARDPSLKDIVTDLVRDIDRPIDRLERRRFLYRVQHTPIESLTSLLRDFHGDRVEVGGTSGASRNTSEGSLQANRARIVASTEENLLLIEATPQDYADILKTMQAVDRPKQQVFLRIVIAEVGLNDSLQYGVEYFLEGFDIDGFGIGGDLSGTPGLDLTAPPSGSTFFVGGDGLAVIQALETAAEVAILQQPTLTITDGEEAEYQVGGEVPVVDSDIDSNTQVDGDTAIRRSIERLETGVILKVTPQINESGLVTIRIDQETNEVGNQTELGPEFTTRRVATTVTIPHGKTVVIGGIIRESQRDSETKIPIAGDIPVLGQLFQSVDTSVERTELFITVTPTIINTPNDGPVVTSSFKDAVFGVRRYLSLYQDDLPRGMLADPRYLPVQTSPVLIRAGKPDAEPINQAEQTPAETTMSDQQNAETEPAAPSGPPPLPPILQGLLQQAEQTQTDAPEDSPNAEPNG